MGSRRRVLLLAAAAVAAGALSCALPVDRMMGAPPPSPPRPPPPPPDLPRTGDRGPLPRSALPDVGSRPESVLWNFWALDEATLRPVDAIAPGAELHLVIDLSTVFSGQVPSPVQASEGTARTLRVLRAAGLTKTTLNLVVVPDALAFAEEPFATSLEVDLVRLEALLLRQRAGELPDRVDGLAESAPYSAGRTTVALTVKPGASGPAPLVLSVWRQDWSEPIDEVALLLDVGGPRPIRGGGRSLAFGALDDPRTAGEAPDGAIHFVAPDAARPVHALFRSQGSAPDAFEHWTLGAGGEPVTGERLTQELTAISQTLGSASSGEVLRQEGRVLHDLLFPGPGAAALDAFLGGRASTPSLRVRMLDPGRSGPLAVPLAFIRRSAEAGFLGDEVRLETPLALRPAAAAQACISSWAILLPPASSDTAMTLIRTEIGAGRVPPGLLPSWATASVAPNDSIASFRGWITGDAASGPLVLLIASHQSQDAFSFVTAPLPEARFGVGNFRRTFSPPSIAILAGCDTGGPDASWILRRLNRQGFTTIIATSTPAKGALLGRFLRLLSEEIASRAGQPIGPTFDRALAKLRADTTDGSALAPRALQITLLGDRGVPVCPPR